MIPQIGRALRHLILATGFVVAISGGPPASASYIETDLVSDVPGRAQVTDPNLRNPWGLAYPPTGPFWASDQAADVSTLYNGAGTRQSLVVTIPGTSPPSGPTGIVFNGSTNFAIDGGPARFIFATLGGLITAWNPAAGTQALVEANVPGAIFTGLALAANGTNTFLYAANSRGGIAVFDANFAPVTLAGNFVDPNVPAGYTPYNVQNINGLLYVTYSRRTFPGGFVDVFNTSGDFVRRVASNGPLEQPWGLTLAPSDFGEFSNALLVGNFGDGRISAYDAATDVFLGQLRDSNGTAFAQPGLWALEFGNGATAGNRNDLYFTAGINNEVNGLFGRISVASVPEPGTLALLLGAIGTLWAFGQFSIDRRQRPRDVFQRPPFGIDA